MCRVGIYGRRKSGRKTAAWLLAKTIEEQLNGTPKEKFEIKYESWVKLVILDESEARSTNSCILESFGGIILDQVMLFCPYLQNYDLHDHKQLSEYVICPTTFEIFPKDEINPEIIETAEDYAAYHDQWVADRYMTLEEFIMLYARDTIKKMFGPNAFLNVAIASKIPSNDTRIYWDVKTQAEANYCADGGVLIELISKGREIDGGYKDIKYLDPDLVIDTTNGLGQCADQFWNAAKYILSKKS